MPFPFTLPTTSSSSLASSFSSSTHPSLPLTAATKRIVVKDALKKNKRLPSQDRLAQLQTVQIAIEQYVPYLLAICAVTEGREIDNERLVLQEIQPFVVEWRTTISATLPGKEPPRIKINGLYSELAFTLSSLAYVQHLLARFLLRQIYGSAVLDEDQRTSVISTAMKHLLQANSIYTFLLSTPAVASLTDVPIDIQPSTLSGLASLSLAEATLIVVTKDDPYVAAVSDDRNENNTDWMFKAPNIPKVRAHLYARISLAAAEHAAQAYGLLARSTSSKLDADLLRYVDNLRRTARARAIRFLALNSEASGTTGEALAWIVAAKRELKITSELESGKRKGFSGLKQSWKEQREDRKIEKGGEWGMDAGRFEEIRILEMLEAKWDKQNSTINVQAVPAFEPLLTQLPTGRDYHTPQLWQAPRLDSSRLTDMRAPIQSDNLLQGEEDDSETDDYRRDREPVPGAFPPHDIDRSRTAASYY